MIKVIGFRLDFFSANDGLSA